MEQMYYIVYKIVNKINGKYYIGVHKTTNKNDGYMGSGKAITRAINKYGVENFEKTILFECSSKEEMFEKEREIVTEEVVRDRKSYNLKPGGTANFYYVNHNGLNHSRNQHLIHGNRIKEDEKYARQFSEKMKEVYERTKDKIKEARTGRKWVHNPKTHKNRHVKDDVLKSLLEQGWELGLDTTNISAFGGTFRRGRILIINPLTGESKFINPSDEIQPGWVIKKTI